MRHMLRSRRDLTETNRATSFEIFFDLVFVFALTQVIAFMGRPPTPASLAEGLILLLLFWVAWMTYSWLCNQARADLGLLWAGLVAAMATIFVAALEIPVAWQRSRGLVDAPLILSLAYIVMRAVHLALYYYAVPRDRRPLRIFAATTILAWVPLVVGALLGGAGQTALWATALVIDFSGGFLASAFGPWQLRSPGHFSERHGLVLIIALGESLVSVGAGARTAVTRGPVLAAALLAFAGAVCLWWLYFATDAPAVGEAFGRVPAEHRGRFAANVYSLTHFPLVAGVIYLALGVEQILAHLAQKPLHQTGGTPLNWSATVALFGGLVLFLTGRVAFLWLAIRVTPTAKLVAASVALLLIPVGRYLPALAALGLVTAFLLALAGYERVSRREHAAHR